MKNLDYKRILCIIAFLALAGFSCFLTAESLFIWQPSITIYGAWLIAIVFYVIASICFSRFIKGFEKYGDFGQGLFASRGGHLFFGFIGLLVFWLLFSLPTNTHTLLYRASVKEVIKTDLTRTQSYLQGLKDNNVEIKKVENEYKTKKDAVDVLFQRLLDEMDRPDAKGIGPVFNTVVAELENVVGNIQRMSHTGNGRTFWLSVVQNYRKQANDRLDLFKAQCDKTINEIKRNMDSKKIDALIKNCEIALANVDGMNDIDNDVLTAATRELANGYSHIKANARYVQFANPNDEYRYTREGAIPEAKEMLSVPQVWKDFLTTDKYDGHGFLYWVFIALLVDLAGFIFFDIAFGKNEKNSL